MTARLIDHKDCGGAGCRGCNHTGIEMAETVVRVAFLHRAKTEEQHLHVRECCACYQGVSINEGVAQCTHARHRHGGEWCSLEDCPLPAADPSPAGHTSKGQP